MSDNDSAEVEIQAGLFRNQETYAFLEPQETVRFRESWMPVREIGGFVRATPDAVLNLERARVGGRGSLAVGLNVTRTVSRGRLRIRDGARVVVDEALSLDPAGVWQRQYPGLASPAPYTVEALDDEGKPLVVHTEGLYDQVPAGEVEVGAQAAPRVAKPGGADRGRLGEPRGCSGAGRQAAPRPRHLPGRSADGFRRAFS